MTATERVEAFGGMTSPVGTSSAHTLKLVNVLGPNGLLSATSAVSRPRAINTCIPARGQALGLDPGFRKMCQIHPPAASRVLPVI